MSVYKEKVAIFDKEFLLKERNNVEEHFQISADYNDCVGLDMFVGYLFDSQQLSLQG